MMRDARQFCGKNGEGLQKKSLTGRPDNQLPFFPPFFLIKNVVNVENLGELKKSRDWAAAQGMLFRVNIIKTLPS